MKTKKNCVFIATSIDGYIADQKGSIDWLNSIPNPDNIDMAYKEFVGNMDALIMGRKSFETVCGFGTDWPYELPVFVLSNTLIEIPDAYKEKAYLEKGTVTEILNRIHKKGYYKLYIDGGTTIQAFLKEDLIDEMIITTIPILLGGGASLFSDLPEALKFEFTLSRLFLNQLTQNYYRRKR